MPLPSFLFSAYVLICERFLAENDGVMSAIRIVDLFFVPEKLFGVPDDVVFQLIQPRALIVIKAIPGHIEAHAVRVRLINTIGESSILAEQVLTFGTKPGFEEAPGTINIAMQLNLGVRRFGTCYVCVDVDGEEVARASITLAPLTPPQKDSETKAQ